MARAQRVMVVTGSRADFGLLEPVMRAIEAEPALALSVVVAGAHLASGTWRDVKAAGFAAAARVPMQRAGRTGRLADAEALGRGVAGVARAIGRLSPDVVLVLGDRIEALAAASAASVAGVRVGHVHGGDRAEGVADEAMRHAISKLAHLHFAATAGSRRRLVRMGEDPAAVWRVGSPAIDALGAVAPDPEAPRAIVMQHPVGGPAAQERRWMAGTLAATARFERAGGRWVLAPNLDPGRSGILAAIRDAGVTPIDHLPRQRFVAALKGAAVIVGNSSAGLIEAAATRTACVNVGPRQAGREKPRHVIDANYGRAPVSAAIREALALDLGRLRHPYGSGDAGRRIAALLAGFDPEAVPLRKRNAY